MVVAISCTFFLCDRLQNIELAVIIRNTRLKDPLRGSKPYGTETQIGTYLCTKGDRNWKSMLEKGEKDILKDGH